MFTAGSQWRRARDDDTEQQHHAAVAWVTGGTSISNQHHWRH